MSNTSESIKALLTNHLTRKVRAGANHSVLRIFRAICEELGDCEEFARSADNLHKNSTPSCLNEVPAEGFYLMKTTKPLLLAALLSLAFNSFISSPAKAEKVLQGQVCEENVHKLTNDIDWYKNLHKAEDAANEQGKLILWVHMVGKIDGAT